MVTDVAAHFEALARQDPQRILFPEGTDPRILQAAEACVRAGICRPVLLGSPDEIRRLAREEDVDLDGVRITNPREQLFLDYYAREYARQRGVKESVAQRIVRRNLLFGAMAVRMGDADGMVGGATFPTARVIEAGALAIGLRQGISVPSSFFIMVLPDDWPAEERVLVYADAAVNIDPSPEELADIAVMTAYTAADVLGLEPRVALLSCSTKGSATHPRVERVVRALGIAREKAPDIEIDGELQADAALVPGVARRKAPASPVAGRANVLIFPDLDSANIAYKITQYFGRAKAYGPMLQGFVKPIADLSRGCSVEDICVVAAYVAVQAQERGQHPSPAPSPAPAPPEVP